jgi:GR25 family glycosyltransferase involved in LPS biosynthesis
MSSIPKFVINLKRRPDRLKEFHERCPLNDVNIVYGFDAKNYNDESEEDMQLFKKVKCYYPGEGGVFVSHLRIFQEIVNKNYPFAFIMEDDAEFTDGFLEKYNLVISNIPIGTDILYIGGRFTQDFIMQASTCIHVSPHIVKHNLDEPWNGRMMDRTQHAYIISNTMVTLLLEDFHSLHSISLPIDIWMPKFCVREKIPIYNSLPLLCHSPMVSDTDIRGWKNRIKNTKLRGLR